MFKTCKHSKCAVCKRIEEREVFKSILKTLYPEIYICKHAMYKITNADGADILLPTLENICDGRQGYYIMDVYTSKYIYLNKENFEIICTKHGECNCELYVSEYIPGQKRAAD